MKSIRVEIIFPNRQRTSLITGLEISEQKGLLNRLSPTVEEVLDRVQIYPTLVGLEVTTYPPSNRRIRLTDRNVTYEPPGSENSWRALFSVRTRPASIIFSDQTEIQVNSD